MCAGCGCDDVNDVQIPGNKSGFMNNGRGVVKQTYEHHENHSPSHERNESAAERKREYGAS